MLLFYGVSGTEQPQPPQTVAGQGWRDVPAMAITWLDTAPRKGTATEKGRVGAVPGGCAEPAAESRGARQVLA